MFRRSSKVFRCQDTVERVDTRAHVRIIEVRQVNQLVFYRIVAANGTTTFVPARAVRARAA
jgi:hypothetical protein